MIFYNLVIAMQKNAAGLFILLLFFACAGGSKVKVSENRDQGSPVKNSHLLDEDFDPNSLQEPASPINPRLKDKVKSQQIDLSRSKPAESIDEQAIGYRVQILQTQDAEEARTVQSDAIVELDAEVYPIFDSPYYKVRVGDFLVRAEAEELLQRVIAKGYKSAWIVRTKINVANATMQEE